MLLALTLVLSTAFFLYFSGSSVYEYKKLDKELKALTSDFEKLQEENRILRSQMANLGDEDFVRSMLASRKYLGANELLVEIVLPPVMTNTHSPRLSRRKIVLSIVSILLLVTGMALYLFYRIRRNTGVFPPISRDTLPSENR